MKFFLILISQIIVFNLYGFDFEFTTGVSLNKGNTDKIGLSGSINIKHITDNLKFILSMMENYNETSGKKDINKGNLTLKCDYDITKHEQAFIFFIPSYNEFQDLKLRTQTGIGNKHTFLKNKIFDLSISGAVLYETKEYLSTKNKWFLGRFSFRPKIKVNFNKNNFLFMFFYQPQIDNFSDYRILMNLKFNFYITKYISFEFVVNDEYNNIVRKNIKRNDLTSYNGVKIKI